MLVLASKEIFKEIGEFTLKLPEIGHQVVIKSAETVEETNEETSQEVIFLTFSIELNLELQRLSITTTSNPLLSNSI